MQITELSGSRFDLALERMIEGYSFTFQDIGFCLSGDGMLDISVDSSWAFDNITTERAVADLKRAQSVYDILRASPAFARSVGNSVPQFILIYDTGNGAVELGRLVGQQIVWAKGFRPTDV